MELKEFVEKTLLDITDAVAAARSKSKLNIAPGYVEGKAMIAPQMVQFDISVTASKGVGGKISVLSFASTDAAASKQTLNKISFEVPVYFQAPTPNYPRSS